MNENALLYMVIREQNRKYYRLGIRSSYYFVDVELLCNAMDSTKIFCKTYEIIKKLWNLNFALVMTAYSEPVTNVGQWHCAKYANLVQSRSSDAYVTNKWTNRVCPRSTVALNNSSGRVSKVSYTLKIKGARTKYREFCACSLFEVH